MLWHVVDCIRTLVSFVGEVDSDGDVLSPRYWLLGMVAVMS